MTDDLVADNNWAFHAYEAARSRLPHSRFLNAFQIADKLSDITDNLDTFLLDGFGVLNVGKTAIPGAVDCVEHLRAQGKKVVLVTNSASTSILGQVERYAKLGFDFTQRDIISSRDSTLAAIEKTPRYTWGLVADPAYGRDGIDHLDTRFLADNSADYDAVDAFLMLGCTAWDDVRQNMLEHSLRRNPRPLYVGNPDIAAPVGGSLSRQPGYYAHRLADVTDVVPQFFGKPFFNIFELVFARLGSNYDPERTVMVGDTLHTDILGGRAAGIKTALITDYGVLSKADINQAVKLSGIVPDYILPRI